MATVTDHDETTVSDLPRPACTGGDATAYEVEFRNGQTKSFGTGPPAFVLEIDDEKQLRDLLRGDLYRTAVAFVQGQFNVRGDLVAAAQHFRNLARPRFPNGLLALVARHGPWMLTRLFESKRRAGRNIEFHYDRSNNFYRQFLDRRLVYSCAYFKNPDWSLDEAQLAKLEHICRKLDLRPGDRFLDVGCGWGALVFHAAGRHGARATGCTLSQQQFTYASEQSQGSDIAEQVEIRKMDYRDLTGEFDKIASVGMFEHVGPRRLRSYFDKIASLLTANGLFLNHGIVCPEGTGNAAEDLFLQRHVFPGGQLVCLSDVILEAESAGFEVLDVENLRPHYARTCRAWVERLQRRFRECLQLVDAKTYRTWLLYLAASSASFERAGIEVHQVLFAKRSSPQGRPMSREFMYT